jgi:hypothetical protein
MEKRGITVGSIYDADGYDLWRLVGQQKAFIFVNSVRID